MKEKIIEWSLGKNNAKMIPAAGEILKSVGGEMLLVEFTRNEEEHWETDKPTPVFIKYIGDFDPMTRTYKIIYSGKNVQETSLRITPEGFSFNNPEEEGWMKRFVTYSLHFKMMEEELYYNRLAMDFEAGRGVIGVPQLLEIKESRQKDTIGGPLYIAGVINTNTTDGLNDGILHFRISEVGKVEKRGKKWELGLRDTSGYYIPVTKYIQAEDGCWMAPGFSLDGQILGDLKIMDIQCPKENQGPQNLNDGYVSE